METEWLQALATPTLTVLLLLGGVALLILLDNALYLFSAYQDVEVLRAVVLRHIQSGDLEKATYAARVAQTPLGRILAAALEGYAAGASVMELSAEEQLRIELPRIGLNSKLLKYIAVLEAGLGSLAVLNPTQTGFLPLYVGSATAVLLLVSCWLFRTYRRGLERIVRGEVQNVIKAMAGLRDPDWWLPTPIP